MHEVMIELWRTSTLVIISIFLLAAWLVWKIFQRRRTVNRLRKLIGPKLSRDKAYIRGKVGIAINEGRREFALVDGKRATLCHIKDILELAIGPEPAGLGL